MAINDPTELARQYADASNLEARIKLHRLYSTSRRGWSAWIFDQMVLPPSGRVLEIGCGNGQLWADSKGRLPVDLSIMLTDLSAGMLADARANVSSTDGDFAFSVADAESLPFEPRSMDAVMANHMLYHVRHIETALTEICRVLKPGGTFFCTTNGESHMREVGELLVAFDRRIDFHNPFVLSFTLQNGSSLLSKHFERVETRLYPDSLAVTSADDLIRYILSIGAASNATDLLTGERLDAFRLYLENQIAATGSIHISKETGMLIAKAAT